MFIIAQFGKQGVHVCIQYIEHNYFHLCFWYLSCWEMSKYHRAINILINLSKHSHGIVSPIAGLQHLKYYFCRVNF